MVCTCWYASSLYPLERPFWDSPSISVFKCLVFLVAWLDFFQAHSFDRLSSQVGPADKVQTGFPRPGGGTRIFYPLQQYNHCWLAQTQRIYGRTPVMQTEFLMGVRANNDIRNVQLRHCCPWSADYRANLPCVNTHDSASRVLLLGIIL